MTFPVVASRGLFTLCVLVGVLAPRRAVAEARAQQSPLEQARRLFLEARALLESGRLGEACSRFEQSLRVEAGTGTKVNLADCWERLGRTASAQAAFLGAAAEAELAGQDERAEVARQRAKELEVRVPKLSVEIEERAPGLSLSIDRVLLDEATWGTPRPLDPGTHAIEARAPGRAPFTKRVTVPASGALVIVAVPPLAEATPAKPAAGAPEPSAPRAKPARSSVATKIPPAEPASDLTSQVFAAGLGLVGVGGLAFGTYYGLQYRSHDADARTICADGGVCTAADIDRHKKLVDESAGMRTRSYVGFAAGAAALTGAALLYFTSRSRSEAPSVGAVVLADGSWSIHADGTF